LPKKNKLKVDKKQAIGRVKKIIPVLNKTYPDAGCSLDFTSPLELLIATILAAQCTDVRVNIVTKELFKKYKNVRGWAKADIKHIEEDIRSTGFYRNKAISIKTTCNKLIEEFNGKVPGSMEELLKLNGVGRKTANVILGNVYDRPAIICDTHAIRLSRRLGLSENADPTKLEFDLMEIVPKTKWTHFCHLMVFHGRAICRARKPDCDNCSIAVYCPSANKPEFF